MTWKKEFPAKHCSSEENVVNPQEYENANYFDENGEFLTCLVRFFALLN